MHERLGAFRLPFSHRDLPISIPRTKGLSTKLTEGEYIELEAAAGEQTLSEWAREAAQGHIVVAPDNASRTELNQVIHRAMQTAGHVRGREHHVRVLLARQDVTGADRQWAEQYRPGDVVRYSKGSRSHGLSAGEYARVAHVDATHNLMTVRRKYGSRVTYDPRRLQGVTLYRGADRAFAMGRPRPDDFSGSRPADRES